MLIEFINEYGTTIIYAVLTGIFGYLGLLAKKYFDKYSKMKRTYEALSELTEQVKEEIDHLESISASLDIALLEEDLVEIKEELTESGYIRRKGGTKKVKAHNTGIIFSHWNITKGT